MIKSGSFVLMLNEGNRIISELEIEFRTHLKTINEQELIRRNNEIVEINRNVDDLASKFPEMLNCCLFNKDNDVKNE